MRGCTDIDIHVHTTYRKVVVNRNNKSLDKPRGESVQLKTYRLHFYVDGFRFFFIILLTLDKNQFFK